MQFWIVLALAAVAFGATKEQADDYVFPDYWQNDYEWYSDEAEKLGIISSENNEPENGNNQEELAEKALDDVKLEDAIDSNEIVPAEEPEQKENDESEIELNEEDKKILQAIDTIRETIETEKDKEPFDLFDDYQFEDNRSDPKEQLDVADDVVEQPNIAESTRDESDDNQAELENPAANDLENEKIFDETRHILNSDEEENLRSNDDINRIFDEINRQMNEMGNEEPVLDDTDNHEIFDETRDILAEDDDIEMLAPAEDTDNQQIFDETRAILDEDDSDKNEKPIGLDAQNNEDISNVSGISEESEDSDDTKEDETITNNEETQNGDHHSVSKEEEKEVIFRSDKEEDDDVEENNIEGQAEAGDTRNSNESSVSENDTKDEPQDDEEDTVDKVIDDLNDDLKQLFETWGKLTSGNIEDDDDVTNEDDVLKYEEKYGKPFREDLVLSQRDDYDNIDDDNIDQLFAKMFDEIDDNVPDKVNEPNSDNASKANDQIVYNNDALDVNDNNKKINDDSEAEKQYIPVDEELKDDVNPEPVDTEKESTKSIRVEDLTPSQYEDLMKQFAMVYNAELDTNADDFGRNVAPIHMTLSVDEPKIIESPNFPNFYPTNNIVDWIFDGEGTGIELNITDFVVNGAIGDYLLIKPGGVDDSRTDGIIFSYTLNEQRNFRFMDVDRMFVRFVSRQAFVGMRGFQFSAKMVAPIQEEPELEAKPAPLLPVPEETLTLNLGGLTLEEFVGIKEEFRQIIADMATLYINTNSIEMGLNTTAEITQITRAELCNVDWPNASYCVEVSVGVPLVYPVTVDEDQPARLNETELRAMWETYMDEDPFSARLWRLGISEFPVPDHRTVLMVWLIIAVGVLVSMSLLAFTLWRFSCFEDYTRMAAYSETDSVNDKRNLDLYPTPHQTLPPLFADTDYKWDDEVKYDDSTRVDMGGFANRSYVRDELFDIDSDEDIVATPRDRYTTDV